MDGDGVDVIVSGGGEKGRREPVPMAAGFNQ